MAWTCNTNEPPQGDLRGFFRAHSLAIECETKALVPGSSDFVPQRPPRMARIGHTCHTLCACARSGRVRVGGSSAPPANPRGRSRTNCPATPRARPVVREAGSPATTMREPPKTRHAPRPGLFHQHPPSISPAVPPEYPPFVHCPGPHPRKPWRDMATDTVSAYISVPAEIAVFFSLSRIFFFGEIF